MAEILEHENGLLIDLRAPEDYLGRHIHGSISLAFEDGPGFSGRARDLLPLSARCVLVSDGSSPLDYAADMLRGKGFDVPGHLERMQEIGGAKLIATEVVTLMRPGNLLLLNVADPGTEAPRNSKLIPVERLWSAADDLDKSSPVGVLAGWGVRAATGVGILEHRGFERVLFVRTRPVGARPPTTAEDPSIFRVSGE